MQRKFNWPRNGETFKSAALAQNHLDLSRLSFSLCVFLSSFLKNLREMMRKVAIIAEKLECES